MIRITTDSNIETEREISKKIMNCTGDYYRWYTKEDIEKALNSSNPFCVIEKDNYLFNDELLKEFFEVSKEYPEVIIKIEVKFPMSYNRIDYIRYVKDGKSQRCNALKIFESFDPRKFKSYEEEFNHE